MPAGKIIKQTNQINKLYGFGIGINKYLNEQLNLSGCVRDVTEIMQALSPFETTLLLDDQATVKNIFAQITRYIKELGRMDMLVISISGHGEVVNKDLAFMPYETEPDNLLGTALSTFYMINALNEISEKGCRVLIILDFCKSGNLIFDISKYSSVLSGGGISSMYACSSLEVAYEKPYGKESRGVFTKHLIDGLNGAADTDGLKMITLRNLYDYVYQNVCSEFRDQHPALIGTLEGNTVLKTM